MCTVVCERTHLGDLVLPPSGRVKACVDHSDKAVELKPALPRSPPAPRLRFVAGHGASAGHPSRMGHMAKGSARLTVYRIKYGTAVCVIGNAMVKRTRVRGTAAGAAPAPHTSYNLQAPTPTTEDSTDPNLVTTHQANRTQGGSRRPQRALIALLHAHRALCPGDRRRNSVSAR